MNTKYTIKNFRVFDEKGVTVDIKPITILTGCNKTIIDTTYTFNYAIIQLPNGEVVEGRVETWTDYEGEQLQIRIDGVTYLCSSYNCVLMNK